MQCGSKAKAVILVLLNKLEIVYIYKQPGCPVRERPLKREKPYRKIVTKPIRVDNGKLQWVLLPATEGETVTLKRGSLGSISGI